MGLEFQIQEDKVCYTPLKDKCDHQRLLGKLELFAEWLIFYHPFYLTSTDY